jgi:hypothetical protein
MLLESTLNIIPPENIFFTQEGDLIHKHEDGKKIASYLLLNDTKGQLKDIATGEILQVERLTHE